MKPLIRLLTVLGTGASLLALAACDSATQPAGRVHATMSIRQGAGGLTSLVSFASPTRSDSGEDDDDHGPGHRGHGDHFAGPIPSESVDSLIVVVSGVRVHMRGEHDSLDDDDHEDSLEVPDDSVIDGPDIGDFMGHGHGHGPHGPGHDSLDDDSLDHDSLDAPDGHEDEGNGWFTLAVVSGGRIDLMHLPTDSANGIVLASGEIPPGTYTRATLDIAEGWLWLNTPFVTPQGDTLPAGQAIPVIVPSGRIHAPVQFVVPEGGGDIPLVFDPAQTLSRIVVTGDGRVILIPVLRHHE